MRLIDIGYDKSIQEYLEVKGLADFLPARIMQENRERYIASTGENEYEAEITGNLRFTASSRTDFPAVGDWVALKVYDEMAIIHSVLPRKSLLKRQAVGIDGEKQIIAANVDAAFIVQSTGFNFNINRLERYMAICLEASIEPVLVISKTDLSVEADIRKSVDEVIKRHPDLRYILLSNITREGLDQISAFMEKGKTYCLMGSSGVGKSTIINNLVEKELLRTDEISRSTNKGKHVTTRRELLILPGGAMIIDTPGMKELGITDDESGIRSTFRDIHELALKCKFPDCTHNNEKGCAITAAISEGIIDSKSLENYRKMIREQERFTATEAEKRVKDRQFGKMAREILKEKKKNKF